MAGAGAPDSSAAPSARVGIQNIETSCTLAARAKPVKLPERIVGGRAGKEGGGEGGPPPPPSPGGGGGLCGPTGHCTRDPLERPPPPPGEGVGGGPPAPLRIHLRFTRHETRAVAIDFRE